MAKTRLGLKQFRAEGCLSYVVWDRVEKIAAIVDPNPELMEDYQDFVLGQGLKLAWAIDTHIHADHFSATHWIAKQFGAQIAMSELTRSERPTRRLQHGDLIALGAFQIQILLTPGHTPDSLCLLVSGDLPGQPHVAGVVFTGDTLLIGGTGRTDFPGSDASALWQSLQEVVARLPEDTLVLPGHDYNQLIFSTIGTEKAGNRHWSLPSLEAFVDLKQAESVGCISGGAAAQTGAAAGDTLNATPSGFNEEVRKRIEFNLQAAPEGLPPQSVGAVTACGAPSQIQDRIAAINVQKYHLKLEEEASASMFLDVREPDEFAAGHIPHTINVPLSELGWSLPQLTRSGRIYISCLGGGRSAMAVRNLTYLGYEQVVNVSGGFKAWQQSGYSVA